MPNPIPCTACHGQGFHQDKTCPGCKGHGTIIQTKAEVCTQCQGKGSVQAGWQIMPVVCTLCHGVGEIRWWSAPEALLPPTPCADIAAAVDLLHASLVGDAGPQPYFSRDTLIGLALHLIALDHNQHQLRGAKPGELLARVLSQGGVIVMAHDGVYHDPLTGEPAVLVFLPEPEKKAQPRYMRPEAGLPRKP